MLGSEVTVLSPNILKVACGWIEDLNIAGEILVSINFGEVAERLIRDFGHIKLVVSNGQQIVIHVLKNCIRDVAVRCCRIAEPSTVVEVLHRVSKVTTFSSYVQSYSSPGPYDRH